MSKKSMRNLLPLAMILGVLLISGCGGPAEEPANNAAFPSNEAAQVNTEPTAEASPTNTTAETPEAKEADVNGVTKNEAGDEIRTERVSFSKGTTSATVKGSVQGYNVVDYVVNAKKGQTMAVSLKSSSTFAYFNVRGSKDGFASELDVDPKAMEETNWKAKLPKSGDYYIRVYLVRAEARRKGKADYNLTVSVTGGDSGEAAVNKPVFYRCPDNMEVVATMKSDGKRVEIEIGDTVLRLNKVPSGSGAKYADTGEKNVFWIKDSQALLDYQGKSFSCNVVEDRV